VTSWLRRKSFRVRLSGLVAVSVGVAVALTAFASYVAVHHQLYSQLDSSIQSEMDGAVTIAQQPRFSPGEVGNFLRRYNNSVFQIINPDSTAQYTSAEAPLPVRADQAAIASQGTGSSIDTVTFRGERYRVLTEGAIEVNPITGSRSPAAVQIARPLSDINHSLNVLRLILWVAGLAGIALGVLLGYLVGKATIRPVVRLTAAAEHVAATQDLDSTIDESGEDELARLARSFNSMLRALAVSRQQQAQLISDAGHELRTPLTSLRTNIEVLLRVKDLPESDRAELLADVQAQLEELTTLIGDVVELGREDEKQAEPIEVRLDNIVAHAVERARRRAPSVTFATQLTPGSVRAQPVLLERAVLNVLDNAAKWSPPGGTVWVNLRRDHTWTLDVIDQGPGIAAEDLPRVFDRFYRAETARSLPGSGLGLAIVRQVVTTHGGTVTAESPPEGGTHIHIELPTVAEHEPTGDGSSGEGPSRQRETVAGPEVHVQPPADESPAGPPGESVPAWWPPATAR
jgi:two-component system sensor histidine kinase MprB